MDPKGNTFNQSGLRAIICLFFNIPSGPHSKQNQTGKHAEQTESRVAVHSHFNEKLLSLNLKNLGCRLGCGSFPTRPSAKPLDLSGFSTLCPTTVINTERL
nr:PREDICTED: LOW QUALITY PROTEIN: 28S ribosomal protein S16, mitochondrial-like [Struthio camelus australis]